MSKCHQVFEVEIMRETRLSRAELKELASKSPSGTTPGKTKRLKTQEFYVADHISKVIAKLELEFKDKSAEVTLIRAAAPILAILP